MKSYDLVAVQPTNDKAFHSIINDYEVFFPKNILIF